MFACKTAPAMIATRRAFGFVASMGLFGACSPPRPNDVISLDATDARETGDGATPRSWCDLPGEDPVGILVPRGFCARVFATVQHARVIRFAPGGELFVASPNRDTAGYGGAGPESARIAVIPDDDHDGRGDAVLTFLPDADAVHGLLFANDSLYYSLGTQILEMPYASGQRVARNATVVANLAENQSFLHWPHTLDRADDGTIYVSRGGDEQSSCVLPRPVRGSIVALDGTTQGRLVTHGLRNPMYLRCQPGTNRCYANELTGDFWDDIGGTEKLIPIRDGDDWGYPCCVSHAQPIPSATSATDCSFVPDPTVVVPLHDTPFGLDFEPGRWPAPWTNRLFIALHGAFNTWRGARVTAVALDPVTGAPTTSIEAEDIAYGWDDGSLAHGRPADVTFSNDGRLFVANDITGQIVWIAPR